MTRRYTSVPAKAVPVLARHIAREHDICLLELYGPRRSQRAPVIRARWEMIRRLRALYPTASASDIARKIGMDHTSVLHALGTLSRTKRTRKGAE